MDERELRALVGMAMEAEGLDAAAAAPRAARAGVAGRRLGPWIVGAGAALAACVGIAAMTWLTWPAVRPPSGGGASPGGVVAVTPREEPTRPPVAEPAATDPWVVLAIHRGWDGECRCLYVERPELAADRPLEAIRPSELLALGLENVCAATIERLIVLGISGPADELPTTRDEAEFLAACLATAGPADSSGTAVQAELCLPAGVTVVAELLEAGRPMGLR